METIAKIRRAYFHQKKPIKQNCRGLILSRKVVRKVIRSKKAEFTTSDLFSRYRCSAPGEMVWVAFWKIMRARSYGWSQKMLPCFGR